MTDSSATTRSRCFYLNHDVGSSYKIWRLLYWCFLSWAADVNVQLQWPFLCWETPQKHTSSPIRGCDNRSRPWRPRARSRQFNYLIAFCLRLSQRKETKLWGLFAYTPPRQRSGSSWRCRPSCRWCRRWVLPDRRTAPPTPSPDGPCSSGDPPCRTEGEEREGGGEKTELQIQRRMY